mgnify:FL=1
MSNRSSMICCPFHTDRNPSMKVDSRFHCFGCGADGDVIDFIAKLFQLSLRRAAEKLVADFGLSRNPVFPLQYPKIVEYKSQNPIQTLYECSAIMTGANDLRRSQQRNLNLPAEWETRAICEIMTAGIANGEIKGWTAHKAAKRYPKYGVQKGWERVTAAKADADGFVELTDEEAQQMGVPF